MWKKKENEATPTTPISSPEPRASRPPQRRTDRAVIGPTLRIQGEISGEEELLVQGRIEGKIVVEGQGVTVGKSGKVKADIHARSIRVEGHVRGDLFGEQEVIIEASGDVQGNLIAPSVRLENGSRFKGSIDMDKTTRPPSPGTARPSGQPTMPKSVPEGEPPGKPESISGKTPLRP